LAFVHWQEQPVAVRLVLKLDKVALPAPRPVSLRVLRLSIGGAGGPAGGGFFSIALPVAVEESREDGRRVQPVIDFTNLLLAIAAAFALLRLMRFFTRKAAGRRMEVK
jgi:hypothetical protein